MDNDGQWGSVVTFTITINQVKKFYYVKDHLGNIRQTLNETGGIAAAQDYYPYGEILRGYNQGQANEKYKFTEKERDIETNFDNFDGRLYDGTLAIWLRPDPIGFLVSPGVSPYTYCYNNPLRYIDPLGLDTIDVNQPHKEGERGDFIKGPDGEVTPCCTSPALVTATSLAAIPTYRSNGKDNSISYIPDVVSNINTAAGIGIAITQNTLQSGNVWLADNLKYYPLSFKGNQFVGGYSKIIGTANLLKSIGRYSLFIGLFFNGVDTYVAIDDNDLDKLELIGADATFSVIGFYGGAPGFVIGVIWFGARVTLDAYKAPLQHLPQEYNCHSTN